MSLQNRALVLDLVQWVAREPRPYTQVMDAWRTSCPRLTIWEDALELGLVSREYQGGRSIVTVTSDGREFLKTEGRC
jgi:hypothetical protein